MLNKAERYIRKRKLALMQNDLKYFVKIKNKYIWEALGYLRKNAINKAVDVAFNGWDLFYQSEVSNDFFDLINLIFRMSAHKFGQNKDGTMKRWEKVNRAEEWAKKVKYQFPKCYRLLSACASINSEKTEYYRNRCLALNPPFYGFYVILFLTWVNYEDKKAKDVFLKMLTLFPEQRDNSYLLYIMSVNDKSKISNVIKEYKKIILKVHNNWNAYNNLGLAYTWIHDFEKASSCFSIYLTRGVEIKDPVLRSVHAFVHGICSFIKGDYENAEKQFDKTARLVQSSSYLPPGQVSYFPVLLKYLVKWLDFDKSFREIFLKESLKEIKFLVERLHTLVRKNHDKRFECFMPLIYSKVCIIEALNDAFLLKEISLENLDMAKNFLKEHQYPEVERDIANIEDFIINLAPYKNIEELPPEKEKELLNILKKGHNFPQDTTYALLVTRLDDLRQINKLNTERIIKEIRYKKKQLEILEKPKPPEPEAEKAEYEVYIPKSTGLGSEISEASENMIKDRFMKRRGEFDIFIFGRSVYVKKFDERTKKFKSLFVNVEERVFKLLVMLLKYKDCSLNVKSLFRKAWADVVRDREGVPDQDKVIVRDYLKTPVSQIRALVPTKDLLDIVKPRNSPFYICRGALNYCVIIDKKDKNKFELSDVDTY